MSEYYNEVSETIQGIVNNGFKLIKVDYDRGYGAVSYTHLTLPTILLV